MYMRCVVVMETFSVTEENDSDTLDDENAAGSFFRRRG